MTVVKYFPVILFLTMGVLLSGQDDKFASARERMVREQIESRGITDPATLRAMRKVPRHLFVPEEYRNESYDDKKNTY